jgi:hypothetical protein
MNIDSQNILETALPLIAYLVSYVIQQGRWTAKTNTAIAGVTIVLAACGTLFIQHKFTGNVLADFLAIAAISGGLQTESLAPLSKWIRGNVVSTDGSTSQSSSTPSTTPDATPKQTS